jgi:hypothetical protein
MASFKTSEDVLDDIAKELAQLGEAVDGELGQEMLDEGAKIIEFHWVKSIKKHNHVDTGAMVRSVGVAKGTRAKKFRDIFPQGKDEKGVRNALKAFRANYGKSGINGSHFVDEAETNAKAEVAVAMQEKLDKYIEKKGM